jgi:hypothetical protein
MHTTSRAGRGFDWDEARRRRMRGETTARSGNSEGGRDSAEVNRRTTWGVGRGSRGRGAPWRRGNRGIRGFSVGLPTVTTPLGTLVKSLTAADAFSSGASGRESPKITDCEFVGSYNLLNKTTPTILVPGEQLGRGLR